MSDAELAALTALVNQETLIMTAHNYARQLDNFAPAYTDYSDCCIQLENELRERKVIK